MNDDLISRSRALVIMRNQWTLHGAMNAVANMPSADAEEQGLLVQFPKKVYRLDTTPLVKGVVEWEVMCGEYNVRDKLMTRLDVVHKGFGCSTASVLSVYHGNKWYLTREEAEAALAKED